MVRSIADFKNTIYLLSYDNNIVTSALDKLQQGRGEEYLTKIIQIPLILPYVEKEEINNIFLNKLNLLVKIREDEFDISYFSELYHNGLGGNFGNLRDVNRYLNVLSFRLELIKEELNIYDYMAIILLKVFEPDLYKYIQCNEEGFVGVKFGNSLKYNEEIVKEKTKKDLDGLFEKLKSIDKENAKNLLITIFPKLESVYSNNSYDYGFIDIWTKKRRAASPLYFKNYFKLNFSENEIKNSELKDIINFEKKRDLEEIFNIANTKKLILLDRILEIVGDIDEKKISTFLQVILSLADRLEFEGPKGLFSHVNEPRFKVSRIFFKDIKNIVVDQRFRIVKEVFENEECSYESMFYIVSILSKEDNSDYKIKKEQINELLDMITDRILDRSKKSNEVPKFFLEILYEMKKLKKEKEAKEIFKNFTKKETILSLLEALVSTSIIETGYTVIEDKYIAKENIENFYNYNEIVILVEKNIINPTEEEQKIIEYLKTAVNKEERDKRRNL